MAEKKVVSEQENRAQMCLHHNTKIFRHYGELPDLHPKQEFKVFIFRIAGVKRDLVFLAPKVRLNVFC